MPRPILATISLGALRHNLQCVRRLLRAQALTTPAPRMWAVLKAAGYGHGVASAVAGFAAADGLAMLDLNEAIQCRELGWTGPLMLLEGFFQPADLPLLAEYGLTAVLHTTEQLDMLKHARLPASLDAYLKVDTGMSRLGFAPAAVAGASARLRALQDDGVLGNVGCMTHFARADDDTPCTSLQLEQFRTAAFQWPGPVSVCNSAATLDGVWRELKDSDDQWVRPGICLYGASPFPDRRAPSFGLRPAMTLSAELIAVREVETGAGIGYGHQYSAARPMRVGVVACGYADGYPRHAVTGTPVTVDGVRTGLLGRVSMDMLVVDLTPVPSARVGTTVVLWGEGGPDIDEVAQAAGTIGYELMCGVAPRVPRRFVDDSLPDSGA